MMHLRTVAVGSALLLLCTACSSPKHPAASPAPPPSPPVASTASAPPATAAPPVARSATSIATAGPTTTRSSATAASYSTPLGTATTNRVTPPAATARTAALPTVARRTTAGTTRVGGCADSAATAAQVMQTLTPQQQVGQLFMVGLASNDDPGDAATLAVINQDYVGNVVLYGSGWNGQTKIAAATGRLQQAAQGANGGVMAFIGGNQEGGQQGEFQAFYGPGFHDVPSALQQGQMDAATLQANAAVWGQDLFSAGLNIDLAPVMDTVDRATAAQNQPIGQYDREFGYTPATVSTDGRAFLRGMRGVGIPVSIKHFPGLGRVTGNTDFTAADTTDPNLTSASDPNLQPFKDGIAAGSDFVMVSSAIYPNYPGVQPGEPALLSHAIMTDLLRTALGFGGVVISDDVGDAVAVADITPADRAVRFFAAGGDMLLTIEPLDIGPMTAAVLARLHSDPAFSQRIQAAVQLVLTEKAQYGLLNATPSCSTAQAAPQQGTGG